MKDREMARRQQEVSGLTTQSNFMACKYYTMTGFI